MDEFQGASLLANFHNNHDGVNVTPISPICPDYQGLFARTNLFILVSLNHS